MSFNEYFSTKRITTFAIMVALNVIANVFTYNIGSIQNFSLTQTCCFISGMLLGPVGGFICGFLGDFIGFLIHPYGVYYILIGIGTGLLGVIPGVMFFLYRKISNRPLGVFSVIIISLLSYIICFVLVTCGVNSYAFWKYFSSGKKTFWVYTSARAIKQLPPTLINFVTCIVLSVSLVSIPYFKDNFYVYKVDERIQQNIKDAND